MNTHLLAVGALVLSTAAIACSPVITVEQGAPTGSNPNPDPNPEPSPHPTPGPISDPTVDPGSPGVLTGGACGDVELHVVGIYEPYDAVTKTEGKALVHIDRPGSVVLFLSSYSATDWVVTAGPDTELVAVHATAYEKVAIYAPDGVETSASSYEAGGGFIGCGYEFPDKDPNSGCETPELVANIEKVVGMKVSSFHGCYAASNFEIGADLSSSSNCYVGGGYEHTSAIAAGCD